MPLRGKLRVVSGPNSSTPSPVLESSFLEKMGRVWIPYFRRESAIDLFAEVRMDLIVVEMCMVVLHSPISYGKVPYVEEESENNVL